jgi:hypothetical protein
MTLLEKFKAVVLGRAKRYFPEHPEQEESGPQQFAQKLKTFVVLRSKRLMPERSDHDEPWSEQLGRILMWAFLLVAGIAAVILLVVLANILVWLSAELAPYLGYAIYLGWAVVIVILTPLAFIRRTKAVARIGLLITAWLFCAILCLGSIDLLYTAWGVIAVFIGLCLFGIGVVPLAFLAALLTSDGSGLFVLLVLAASAAGMAFAVRRMEHRPAVTTEIANQSELG